MNVIRFFLFIFLTVKVLSSPAQAPDSSINFSQLPEKYYAKVDKKLSSVNEQLSKKSAKYLAKFERRENKIRKKLRKLNPEHILAGADEKYNAFIEKIKTPISSKGFLRIKENLSNKSPPLGSEDKNTTSVNGEYNPYLDSLNTSLSFLKQYDGLSDKVKNPLASLHSLESKLQQSEKIKEFIADRKNQLKEALSKYAKIPPGLKSQYDKLSKTAYYYSAQVNEYKEMLKDPKKIEQKALSLLNKLPAFQKFMKENSRLASLFRIPDNYGSAQNLTGLQTRSSVQTLIQQRITAGGPNAQAQIQQNLAAANAEMNKLKDRFSLPGGDMPMPDFKPNSQKTKTLFKRLEYGFNVQFGKNNSLVPSSGDLALSAGYKLNDNSVAGIALSYKLGLGNIQHIQFTSQGLGIRSFLDYKIKKQFYITGGYEMNYYPAYQRVPQVSPGGGNLEGAAWQRSGLLGVSKKYAISKKVKGNLQFLYDFLANTHLPVSQQFLFRTGYTF